MLCSNSIEKYTVGAIINGQQELSLDNCLHCRRQIFVIPFLYVGILNCLTAFFGTVMIQYAATDKFANAFGL